MLGLWWWGVSDVDDLRAVPNIGQMGVLCWPAMEGSAMHQKERHRFDRSREAVATTNEVARATGTTRQNVHQIERKAIAKLAEHLQTSEGVAGELFRAYMAASDDPDRERELLDTIQTLMQPVEQALACHPAVTVEPVLGEPGRWMAWTVTPELAMVAECPWLAGYLALRAERQRRACD